MVQLEQEEGPLDDEESDGNEQHRQDPEVLQGLDHEDRPEERVEPEGHYQVIHVTMPI